MLDWCRSSPLQGILDQVGAGGFGRTLAQLGMLQELDADLPFTLFAPLAGLPVEVLDSPRSLERIVGFHLIRGAALRTHELGAAVTSSIGQRLPVLREPRDGFSIDGARLLGPDLQVRAGIVHVIDQVLLPAELDLLELLDISDNFDRLVTACELLGLEPLLRGSEAHTLLVPRGLMLLPTWRWHAWLKPEGRIHLRRLLERHIVVGRCYLDDHVELPTLAGGRVVVERRAEGWAIDGRKVLIANVEARNGLIHVIEGLERA